MSPKVYSCMGVPLIFMLLVIATRRVNADFYSMNDSEMDPSLEEFDVTSEHEGNNPDEISSMVESLIQNNTLRHNLGVSSCKTGNPIDDCWRCDPNWSKNRQRLADCAIGFGRNAIGGKNGKIYVVTDPSDNDAVNPRPGTLRFAVLQKEPLWVIFQKDMNIKLKQELMVTSYKTIDARGVKVQIAYGGGITISYETNVIIHGLNIHHIKPTGNAMIRSSQSHFGHRAMTDGDAINIFASSNIWIDHNTLSSCADGLVDVVLGSTAVTISNNHFSNHDKVMLLGHSDSYSADKKMQVTVAYNHFGENLIERMPRVRYGYAHVVNNDYTQWGMYAIGGSANPTIFSQGNRFLAPNNRNAKEVTKIIGGNANMRSQGDLFLNGAHFTPSGSSSLSNYARASSMAAKPASSVGSITSHAGAY